MTINYVAVGPEGLNDDGTPKATTAGTVTPASETLKVLSGTAQGSTATANEPTFRFVGWYTDAACTQAVGKNWVDANNKLTPQKNTNGVYEAATYYAKFEYNLTTLTITKSGMQGIDNGQSFLFRVKGYGLPESGLLIAINENGSETISGLTVGKEYKVTEVSNWSWRYTPTQTPSEITLSANAANNVVTITNKRDKQQWLDGDCYAENVFVAAPTPTPSVQPEPSVSTSPDSGA